MNITLPRELEEMVEEKVRSGQYPSAAEVVREALMLFEDREKLRQIKLEELRKDLAIGIAQADRGEFSPLDMKAIKAECRARKKAQR
jgi:antitoxin ParD1/3/4